MSRRHARVLGLTLALALGAALAAPPALASEASDAYNAARKLKDETKKGDEAARQNAQKNLEDFAKSKVDVLAGQRAALSKLDLMYLGMLQGMAGDREGGIATLRQAVEKKEESKYAVNVHVALAQALIDAGQPDGAAAEVEKVLEVYADAKEAKIAVMNLGMAYRGALQHEKAAAWLHRAVEMGKHEGVKPLVNSLLMLDRKDDAVAVVKKQIDTGVPQMKEDMQVLLGITEKHGTNVADLLKFDAWVPQGEGPDMNDKIVVLAFSHMSAKTLKHSLRLLDNVRKAVGDQVAVALVTTYYKKDFESGKIDESVTPEKERSDGARTLGPEGVDWRGYLGYVKSEDEMKAWGVSAIPHVVVVAKDRTLMYANTWDFSDGGQRDWAILQKVLEKAQR